MLIGYNKVCTLAYLRLRLYRCFSGTFHVRLIQFFCCMLKYRLCCLLAVLRSSPDRITEYIILRLLILVQIILVYDLKIMSIQVTEGHFECIRKECIHFVECYLIAGYIFD